MNNTLPAQITREKAEAYYRSIFQNQDLEWQRKAKKMFITKDGLMDAIKSKIIPCVVSIRTNEGTKIGTGFFQHQRWLVSNAPVLSDEHVISSATLTDFQSKTIQIISAQNFPRPNQQGIPDITVVNIESDATQKCLPTTFSNNEAYTDLTAFYVYFNQSTQEYKIEFLEPVDKNSFPLRYQPKENPQHGCSGSPLIEARVILGKEPKWQFRTAGTVYAKRITSYSSSQSLDKLLAIPVCYDFKQILKIIQLRGLTLRCTQMIEVCDSLAKDQQTQGLKQKLISQYDLYYQKAEQLFKEYLSGKTEISIDSLEDDELLVKQLELQASANARRRAADRSQIRTNQFRNNWDVMSVRALANHFTSLGEGIFQHSTNTDSNKTIYTNRFTGWSVTFDKEGEYSTVQNEYGTNVALDGRPDTAHPERVHFRNRLS